MTDALEKLQHSKATQQLVQFWLNLPRPEGQVCPRRSDFSSAQINGSISEVFLSEWEDSEVLRVVQAGTVLDRHIGIDMTGTNIFDMTPEELVEDERTYYKALRDQPCAGMITRSMINFADVPFVYRTIQLPLLDPFGKVVYFVGTGVVIEGDDLVAQFGRRSFRRTRLVERHFFDIGAGTPPPEKAGQLSLGGPLHPPAPRG
ncbi:PAS domain-containing protein [Kordiimonas lipolytica]|uniref:PAS domain-containing protein n=1 Tax=Kordiimonas lipolytica TaxID=1662421 RepID=A0ABV8U7S3_9PROT|nr:PAS domain-containing protein [Kordiimonas lipolytica]